MRSSIPGDYYLTLKGMRTTEIGMAFH